MKSFIKACIFLIVFISIKNYAQDSDFNMENLKAPSMPSATIIGIQVNEVNSPKSLKALETAVFTNYLNSDQGLTVPNNYALEFNSFMLSGRKNFDYLDYLANEVLSNIWRNLSISVSSTNKFLITDSISSNAMGFGLRTIILNGDPKKEVAEAFKSALATNQDILNIKSKVRTLISVFIMQDTSSSFTVDHIRSFVLQELEKDVLNKHKHEDGQNMTGDELTRHILLVAKTKTIVNSVFNEIDRSTPKEKIEDEFERIYDKKISTAALEQLRKTLKIIKKNRYGFRWEVDLAYALSFPTNEFNNSISPRWGLWTNVSYKTEEIEGLTFIGLGRIIINNEKYLIKYNPIDESFRADNIYDFGARLVYEYDKFSLEFEYIYRFNRNKIIKIIDGEEYERNINNDTRKYILNVNYNVADNINISYNIGKNFDNISTTKGNLISGLSINFGFGDIKASELLSKK